MQLEATRRIRTDPEFRRVVEEREQELAATRRERLERLRPQVREDVPVEAAAIFLSFVANGLALRQAMGDPLPDLDAHREARRRGRRAALAASRARSAPVPRPSACGRLVGELRVSQREHVRPGPAAHGALRSPHRAVQRP